jgi:hypothetical protein
MKKLVDEGVSSRYPPGMLVRKPPVLWCNFPHHLVVLAGLGEAADTMVELCVL